MVIIASHADVLRLVKRSPPCVTRTSAWDAMVITIHQNLSVVNCFESPQFIVPFVRYLRCVVIA